MYLPNLPWKTPGVTVRLEPETLRFVANSTNHQVFVKCLCSGMSRRELSFYTPPSIFNKICACSCTRIHKVLTVIYSFMFKTLLFWYPQPSLASSFLSSSHYLISHSFSFLQLLDFYFLMYLPNLPWKTPGITVRLEPETLRFVANSTNHSATISWWHSPKSHAPIFLIGPLK
jgi:flagellar basal body rod protein FlgB